MSGSADVLTEPTQLDLCTPIGAQYPSTETAASPLAVPSPVTGAQQGARQRKVALYSSSDLNKMLATANSSENLQTAREPSRRRAIVRPAGTTISTTDLHHFTPKLSTNLPFWMLHPRPGGQTGPERSSFYVEPALDQLQYSEAMRLQGHLEWDYGRPQRRAPALSQLPAQVLEHKRRVASARPVLSHYAIASNSAFMMDGNTEQQQDAHEQHLAHIQELLERGRIYNEQQAQLAAQRAAQQQFQRAAQPQANPPQQQQLGPQWAEAGAQVQSGYLAPQLATPDGSQHVDDPLDDPQYIAEPQNYTKHTVAVVNPDLDVNVGDIERGYRAQPKPAVRSTYLYTLDRRHNYM